MKSKKSSIDISWPCLLRPCLNIKATDASPCNSRSTSGPPLRVGYLWAVRASSVAFQTSLVNLNKLQMPRLCNVGWLGDFWILNRKGLESKLQSFNLSHDPGIYWSQWLRDLRHELPLPPQTLCSYVRIQLEACLLRVCVVLCVGSGLETGWSPVQGVLPIACRIRKVAKEK
jgi:hypothetical protein